MLASAVALAGCAMATSFASLTLWVLIIFCGRMIAYNWFDCDKQPQPRIINTLAGCVAEPQAQQ